MRKIWQPIVALILAASALAALLRRDGAKAVLLGPLALAHPDYSLLREVAAAIATAGGATLGFLPEGANSTGAVLAGALPHRLPGGAAATKAGEGAGAMLSAPRPAVLLLARLIEGCAARGQHVVLTRVRRGDLLVVLNDNREFEAQIVGADVAGARQGLVHGSENLPVTHSHRYLRFAQGIAVLPATYRVAEAGGGH